MRTYRYSYATVEIPRDCSEDSTERENLAYLAAQEQFRTWAVPARWWVVWDRGDYVRICRATRR